MSRVFINYRRQDSEGYVGRLYDMLAKRFERSDIFMDVDNIPPGADFVSVLEDAVAACEVFLAVIGPIWATITDAQGRRRLDNSEDFVRRELALALKRKKLVIPILVGHAHMPSLADIPDELAPLLRRNAIEVSHQGFAHDVDRLANVIAEALAHPPETPPEDNTVRLPPPPVLPTLLVANPHKEAQLKAIRADLINATASPLYTIRNQNNYFPVIGEGHPDAHLMLIGAAPGKYEAEQGRPFVGPSGDILDEMLATIQLRRAEVFITNLVLDYPGEKRDPTLSEIAFYGPFLDRLLAIVQPRLIGTLGGFATDYLLQKLDLPEKREKIGQIHGRLIQARLDYGEVNIVPLYHPALVLYKMTQKEPLRRDFAKLKQFI